MSEDPGAENLAAWRRWLEAALPGRDHEAGLQVVTRSARAGLQSDEIAALLRAREGITTPMERMALGRASFGLAGSLARLRAAPAGQGRADIEAAWAALLEEVNAVLPPAPAGGRLVAPPRPGPAFSWRQFLSEHAIQLLGYSGAFLLGIAVLLFDLTGQSPSRFFALAGLDAALFAAAYGSSRIASLRVLFRAYTAMAALALPLTLLAAYVFLDLRTQIDVLAALSIGGVTCAVTYGLLARTLSEPLYAWVSLGAFGGAIFCGGDQVLGGPAPGGAVLAAGALALSTGAGRLPAIFHRPAAWLTVVTPAAAGYAGLFPTTLANAPAATWALTLALAFASATYGVRAVRAERPRLEWLTPWAVTATALSLLWLWSPPHVTVQFVLLALAAANGVWGRLRLEVRWWEEGIAAALLLPAVLLMSDPAGPQALFFLAAVAGAAAGIAVWRSRLWSFYLAGLLAIGWYWFGAAVLPRPPSPGPDDLAKLYAALPVLFYAAGVAARRLSPELRLAAYLGFAATSLFAVGAALAGSNTTLAGAVLLVCSALGYALTLLERPALSPAPLAGMVGGSLLLLGSRSSDLGHFLLLVAAWAIAIRLVSEYLARSGRTGWALPQRYSALLLAAAAGGGAGVVAWSGRDSGALAELAIVQLLAAAVFTFDWRAGERMSFYVAWTAVAGVAIPVASALRLADDQFRVAPFGIALLLLGVRAAADGELINPRTIARWLQGGGLLLLLGFTFTQIALNWGEPSQTAYTGWLATEAVITILVGVGVRSRWPALAGGAGLVVAAASAISLLAARLPLSAVFGILAAVLIVGATGLALVRGRLKHGGRSLDWAAWL